MSVLEVRELRASYGRKTVISGASFSLEAGRICGILGANGCGKTTLIKALCGVIPRKGSVVLSGRELSRLSKRQLARRVSYIPQRSGICANIPVLDVVTMGFNPRLPVFASPTAEMKRSALSALERVGLGGREGDDYQTLSEGQKQLCHLARALVSDAELYLLDEPESALDFSRRGTVFSILARHVADDGRLALVSLHDPYLALNLCHDLLLMSDGGVRLVSIADTPQSTLETMLEPIYGKVSLHRIAGEDQRPHTVILKEEL